MSLWEVKTYLRLIVLYWLCEGILVDAAVTLGEE